MGFNQTEFYMPGKSASIFDSSNNSMHSNTYLNRDNLKSFLDLFSQYENNSAASQWTAQALADKAAMDFESQEASAYREWVEKMQLDTQNFNAAQSGLDRAFQKSSAEAAMRFEREEREFAQDFSKMMSDTAYQRAVNDLKAAGLNPILAYTQGGASTPTVQGGSGFSSPGSAARVSTPSGKSASGKSGSRSKANTSTLASALLNYSSSIVSNSAKMINAVGQIIPL